MSAGILSGSILRKKSLLAGVLTRALPSSRRFPHIFKRERPGSAAPDHRFFSTWEVRWPWDSRFRIRVRQSIDRRNIVRLSGLALVVTIYRKNQVVSRYTRQQNEKKWSPWSPSGVNLFRIRQMRW